MDSRDVSTLIRRHARPVLAQQGFETFTTRTAWRRWEEGVDVVNFQSVGADYAAVVGCTPFSFVVNLGIYLHYVPHGEVRQRDGGPAPEEHECTLRGHVVPPGPRTAPDVGSHDVWYLRADGSDAEAAVREAAALLDERAPRWFERFRDPRSVLAVLGGPEQADEFETFGFGDDPSPLRHALRGFVAARAGDRELARRELEALLAGGVDVHFDAARRVLATLP